MRGIVKNVRATLIIAVGLFAQGGLATVPRVAMDARPAPAKEPAALTQDDISAKLATTPRFQITSLPLPSSSELFRHSLTKSTERPSLSFGRDPISLGIDGRVAVPTGTSAVVVELSSAGALHLRSAWRFADDAEYRVTVFAGSDGTKPLVNQTGGNMAGERAVIWSAITSGERQQVLIERASPANGEWTASLERVAHFDQPLIPERNTFRTQGLGDSASCQKDIACVLDVLNPSDDAIVLAASRGVAIMYMTATSGSTSTCTGTLLNNASYPRPYFLTAYHCIEGAATLDTFWFFSRTSCGYGTVSPAVQGTGGARIPWASRSLDSALLDLMEMPPAGSSYTGWNGNPLTANELMLAIHHPRGDVKKASLGEVVGTNSVPTTISGYTYPAHSMYSIDWYVGVVEHGSSGSAFFTFSPSRSAMQVRGTLTGGNPTCSAVYSRTYYQRFDYIYANIATILNSPPPPTPSAATAVEYFHQGMGHYFVTADPGEIPVLDSGAIAGWVRTGQTFRVFPLNTAGAANVCRFFTAVFAPRSTHFYTGTECAALRQNPVWTFEGEVFALVVPSATGGCPAGTIALYRLYNNARNGAPNHRYTTSNAVRNQMIAQSWTPEGWGPLGVISCVPN